MLHKGHGPREPPPSRLFESFQARRIFGSLDGLRALSIAAVIWHHSGAPLFPSSLTIAHEGNRGVNLFFVISAFLISTLLIRSKRRGTLDVKRFWCRRALRILPLYYAMLLVYVVATVFAEKDVGARSGFFAHLPYFATFTSNWFVALDSPRVIFYFAWSLAAEEQFYLCWPWVERFCSKFTPIVVAVTALLVTQLCGAAWNASHSFFGFKLISSVPAAILFGVILAHVLDHPKGFAVISAVAARRGSGLAAAILLLVTLWIEPMLGPLAEVAVALALTFLVASCVVREDSDLAWFLRAKPIAWVGIISYGIYLMHPLCIAVARTLLGPARSGNAALLFIACVVLSVAAASCSYLTYERWFLRLKERFSDHRADAAAPRVQIKFGTRTPATALRIASVRPPSAASMDELRSP